MLAGLGLWWVQGVALSFVRDFFSATVNGYVALWASVLLAAKLGSTALLAVREGLLPVPQQEEETVRGEVANA